MIRRRRGYTLFEVLVAFALMTLVLGALLPGQARLLTRADQAESRILAQDLAFSAIDLVGLEQPLRMGRTTRDIDGWTVETTVANAGDVLGQIPLARVDVRILDATGRERASARALRPLP